MCVITDARYFPVDGAEDEQEGSDEEESGSKAPTYFPAELLFDAEAGILKVEKEENTSIYFSVLSSPPRRKAAATMPTSASSWSPPSREVAAFGPTSVDPWSAGSDLWERNVGSAFADKCCHVQSPAAPTAADTTSALFNLGPTSSPPTPMEVCARRPREQEMSTNISVADARRERLLPSCTCQLVARNHQCGDLCVDRGSKYFQCRFPRSSDCV